MANDRTPAAAKRAPPLIRLDGLTRRFGDLVAVDDLSFDVGRGEVVGLIGPNGAGKTTAMRMVAGFLAPTAGRAAIAGIDVVERPAAAKAKLGYLPEGAPAWGEMTPQGLLAFVATAHDLTGERRKRRVATALGLAGLAEMRRRRIDTLSKGFRRRVALAAALVHDPPALILDEPTDGLDPAQKGSVRRTIAALARDKAVIVSTHALDEVMALCTRVVVLTGGRLVADSRPDTLAAGSGDGSLEAAFLALTGGAEKRRPARRGAR